MIRLIYLEFKKLFFKRSILILLILTSIFAYFSVVGTFSSHGSFINMDDDSESYTDEGKLVDGRDKINYINSIRHEYAGIINEQWQLNLLNDLNECKIKELLLNVDEKKMINDYGNNWKELYLSNSDQYIEISEEVKDIPEDKLPFYIKSYDDYKTLIRYETIFNILATSEPITEKSWDNINIEKTYDEERVYEYSEYIPINVAKSQALQKIFKSKLNNTSFIFDDYQGWSIIVNAMSFARFLFAIIIVFICSKCFNDDHNCNMIDVVKSTQYGKKKLVFIKLIAILLTCVSVTIVYTGLITLLTMTLRGLGNWETSIIFMSGNVSPYTFKDAYFGGFSLLLLGSITIGFISVLLSVFMKKAYFSFAISLLIMVLPSVLNGSIAKLFPVNYMDFLGIYTSFDMIYFFESYYSINVFAFLTTFILFIVLSLITVFYYRTYKYVCVE